MHNVFLIGDSIRLGYRKNVAEELGSDFAVYSPDANCQFTQFTLRWLHSWAEIVPDRASVEVVHWNNGLWDLSHYPADGLPVTLPEDYEKNLRRIILQIKMVFPNAKIVFATITPVAPTHGNIRLDELESYNETALRVMAENGIPVNDLHGIVAANPEYISPDKIHMTPEGYVALGRAVADAVRRQL